MGGVGGVTGDGSTAGDASASRGEAARAFVVFAAPVCRAVPLAGRFALLEPLVAFVVFGAAFVAFGSAVVPFVTFAAVPFAVAARGDVEDDARGARGVRGFAGAGAATSSEGVFGTGGVAEEASAISNGSSCDGGREAVTQPT